MVTKMGKREKKPRHPQKHSHRSRFSHEEDDDFQSLPSSLSPDEEEEEEESEEEDIAAEEHSSTEIPSKFLLYQQSVQSPKGDISYLQKFFMMYVGGREPLHFQEDFCGTALLSDTLAKTNGVDELGIKLHIDTVKWNLGTFALQEIKFAAINPVLDSTEWLRTDPRRTAVGLDFDLEALQWCVENNINRVGADHSRISLFHGNVLDPLKANFVKFGPQELIRNISLEESEAGSEEPSISMADFPLPARDIVCAFNFSCCCLHKRAELVLYFKHVLAVLPKNGGIFVMDLYGGASSEKKLKLQRKFTNFTYTWEQAEFNIIERKTRISIHYHFRNNQKKLSHAFSYSWRLWSLPEIKECLDEAGFRSVHFWLREMPDTAENRSTRGFGAGRDIKYEEMSSFEQKDSWNAYIIGVA